MRSIGFNIGINALDAGGGLLSRVQALFDGGTYPGFMFKASRFGDGFFYQESTGRTLVTATTQSIGLAIDNAISDGRGVVNRLNYSQQLDNVVWIKSFATVTANAAAAPDGTMTADTLTETAVSNFHSAYRTSVAIVSGETWTLSAYAKPNGRNEINLYFDMGGSNTVTAVFNVATGVISVAAATTGSFSAPSASIEAAENDYYRCSITATVGSTGNSTTAVELYNGGRTYLGDGVSGAHIWEVQFEKASATTAYQTNGEFLGGPGYHATQYTANSCPTLQQPSGYAFRYDGLDDYMITTLNPQSSGALIFGGTMNAAGDLAMGSADAAPNRCFLGTNASGYLGAGIGSDSYSTIQGSTDITGIDGFNAVRWNGATVNLNRDDTATPIYSSAQNGTPVNSTAIYLGAYNNNGTAGLFADADIDFFFAIMGRELSNNDLALIKAYRNQ